MQNTKKLVRLVCAVLLVFSLYSAPIQSIVYATDNVDQTIDNEQFIGIDQTEEELADREENDSVDHDYSENKELDESVNSTQDDDHQEMIEESDEKNITTNEPQAKTIDSESPTVHFEDSELRNAIARELKINDRPITERDMEKLTSLWVPNYGIQSLDGLQYAINLENLSLQRNRITDILVLSNLSNLESVNLNENPISDISVFRSLTKLRSLNLENILSTDEETIEYLTDIGVFVNYSLTPNAPKGLFADGTLHDLVANDLGIKGRVLTEEDLDKLEKLDISYKSVHSLGGLEYANNLSHLDLSWATVNDFSTLPLLTGLKYLNLHSNYPYKDLEVISSLNKLEYLNIQNSKVTDISELSAFPNLKELYVGGTSIKDLTPIEQFTDLEALSVNYLKGHDLNFLSKLVKLKYLDASGTDFNDISVLANLPKLETLIMYYNDVKDIQPLQKLVNLKSIDFYESQISDISPLENLVNLEYIRITSSQISDISPLAKLTKLKFLGIPNNNVSDISVLANLTSIERLDLIMNNITDVSSLSNLDNLVDLDVSWNFITDLKPLAKIKNLQYLFIQSNNLTNIQALKDAKKLVQISLSDNFIDDQETIQYFLDRGVAIYGLDEQHQQIEHETLLPLFPESKGYEIKKDGSISIDLSKQENKQAAKLDTEQVEMLIKNRKPLIIYRSGVTVNIPISAFLYGKDPITIEVIEEAAEKNSLSKTFVFKITQGSKVISQFEQGITLTFEVDRSLAQNVNNLKVFYFNEEKGVWENIGGSYNGGKVTVVTNHFSKFAVFEVAGNDPTSNTIVEIIKTDNNNNHVPGNKSSNDTAQSEESSNKPISSNNGSTTRLPETATNLYAFLLIGVLLCLGGASAIILNRRVARVTR